jgi:hypothetical protein
MPSIGPVISYPIPAYQNVPVEPENYQPRRYVISAISLGLTTTITTTSNMDYVIGQNIRLLIPSSFGSIQLNNAQGYVVSIPSPTQVEVSINSVGANAFINSSAPTKAQILAIGDIGNGQVNSTGRSNTGTFIPGSFINISPA